MHIHITTVSPGIKLNHRLARVRANIKEILAY